MLAQELLQIVHSFLIGAEEYQLVIDSVAE